MRKINELSRLIPLKREHHHPLVHKLHKKYGISRRTLFYMKEYGPHTHVPRTIIKESFKVLLLASIISSIGGLSIEYIKATFIALTPLIILLPALNDMIGDFGIVISSRFSTLLNEGKTNIRKDGLGKLLLQVLFIAIIMSLISSALALISSSFTGYGNTSSVVIKIFLISMLDTLVLVSLLFLVAVFAGLYFYKKKEDPNNFLIPITTSIADFGNIILLSILVILFF